METILEDPEDLKISNATVINEEDIDMNSTFISEGSEIAFDPLRYPNLFKSALTREDLVEVERRNAE